MKTLDKIKNSMKVKANNLKKRIKATSTSNSPMSAISAGNAIKKRKKMLDNIE